MRSKRGMMISVFIIIGIFILAAVLFALAYRAELFKSWMPVSDSVVPIQHFVEECVDKVSKYGVYRMGMQGGYLVLPEDYFQESVFEVGYAHNNRKEFLSLEEMEQQLETFILVNLPDCLNDFQEFRREGFDIQAGEMDVDIMLAEKDSVVVLNLPLTIMKGEFYSKPDKFVVPLKVAVKEVHSGVDAFVSDLSNNYDMTYLNGLNANVSVNAFGETDLFAEQNFDSVISGMDYIFLYAIR